MLPVLEQQMDGAMSHAPSSHPARVRPAMMKMRLELQGNRSCTIYIILLQIVPIQLSLPSQLTNGL